MKGKKKNKFERLKRHISHDRREQPQVTDYFATIEVDRNFFLIFSQFFSIIMWMNIKFSPIRLIFFFFFRLSLIENYTCVT